MPSREFFGTYKLIREVGHGGMGSVYLADDPQTGRPVALKILPQHLSKNPQFRERFKRECDSLKRLDHPGIPKIFEDGEIDERRYLTMEFIEGDSLEGFLRNRPDGAPDLAEGVMRRLGDILSYAHSLNIIHRDISPTNIILTQSGDIKLIDFGIAKLTDEMTLTLTGQHFGTPCYMAPEQFDSRLKIDARADIWSAGAVIYEILTGVRPFPADSISTLVSSLLNPNHRLKPPSSVRPGVLVKWDLIVMRCLCRDVSGRYAACADILADLDSPAAVPPSFIYRSDKAYVPGEVFYHDRCRASGQVIRLGKIGRRGLIEADVQGRTLALSAARPPSNPGGYFPTPTLRQVGWAFLAALVVFGAGVAIGWGTGAGTGERAVGPEVERADAHSVEQTIPEPSMSDTFDGVNTMPDVAESVVAGPPTKSKAWPADELSWASNLNLKIEKVILRSGRGGKARTYSVQDGKYYLYVTTIRESRGNQINLSPVITRELEGSSPFFVVIEPEAAGDVFVIPGNILSVDTIEKFNRTDNRSTSRYASVRTEDQHTYLRALELELDITPYKNAFHLLTP